MALVLRGAARRVEQGFERDEVLAWQVGRAAREAFHAKAYPAFDKFRGRKADRPARRQSPADLLAAVRMFNAAAGGTVSGRSARGPDGEGA